MENPIVSKKLASQKPMCDYLKNLKAWLHFKFHVLASQKYVSGLQL